MFSRSSWGHEPSIQPSRTGAQNWRTLRMSELGRWKPKLAVRVENCPGKHLQMRKATLTGVTVVAWVTGVTGVVMFIAHVNLVYTRGYPSRCYGGCALI